LILIYRQFTAIDPHHTTHLVMRMNTGWYKEKELLNLYHLGMPEMKAMESVSSNLQTISCSLPVVDLHQCGHCHARYDQSKFIIRKLTVKSYAVLAAAIFLICAPSPDPRTLSEVSQGFLSHSNYEQLIALETTSPKPVIAQQHS